MADEKNPFTEIFKTISDRISSPVTGTYLLTWLLYNWQIVIILFYDVAKKSSDTKIDLIKAYHQENGLCIFIVPLFITVIYLWIIPYIRKEYSLWLSDKHYEVLKKALDDKYNLKEVETERFTRLSRISKLQALSEVQLVDFQVVIAELKDLASIVTHLNIDSRVTSRVQKLIAEAETKKEEHQKEYSILSKPESFPSTTNKTE
jgi:hypothetical protein